MFTSKKYDLILRFFRKEISNCVFITEDVSLTHFCVDYNSSDWLFMIHLEPFESSVVYYNKKYFDDFLFKIFDVLPHEETFGMKISDTDEYLQEIKNLLIDSKQLLDIEFNRKLEKETFHLCGVFMLDRTLELMVDKIKNEKYEGGIEI